MAETKVINFSTADTFDSTKIEIVAGKAQLKIGGKTTGNTFTDNMDSGVGKTFPAADVEFVAGEAKLKAGDNTGQIFNQPFTSSTGFTFDANKTEFAAGKAQQKDTRPANATFAATYTTDIDGSWGDGTLTGTATGAAAVSGGKLDLKNKGANAFVDYAGASNADLGQTGTFKVKFTPDFTGNPPTSMIIITAYEIANPTNNKFQMWIDAGGAINLDIRDSAGAGIVSGGLAVFSAVSGVEVEFEIDMDVTAGATRVFLDGVQQGATQVGTGTRTGTIDQIRLGGSDTGSFPPDFELDDPVLFNAVEHTAGYTPGYTIEETIYLEDLVTYPTFTYTGVGNIQAFTAFTTAQTGGQQFNIDGQYWNGAAWVVSDDSLGQMNPVATISANIGTLGSADSVEIKSRWTASNNQQDIDDLNLTYTGQIFPITNPTIVYDANNISSTLPFTNTLTSFTETSTKGGSDEIQYQISTDGGSTFLWFSATWQTSDNTFAQSNTASAINANIATFPVGAQVLLKIFLHSDDGSTTPALSQIDIGFDLNEYAIDNPTIETNDTIGAKTLEGFFEDNNVTKPTGSEIQYVLIDGSTQRFFNGSVWATSDGTFTQSNLATVVDNNRIKIVFVNPVKVKAFLHSDDGSVTPAL